MITLYLTALQLCEITHKLYIVAEEPELQEAYEISAQEAQQIADLFHNTKHGYISFDDRFYDLIIEETKDRMESLRDNWKYCGNEADGGIYRSLFKVVKQLEAKK